jgi:CheY-like chemotaxis protein
VPRQLLVIDDEPFIGRIVRMQFERGPYTVSVALDGRTGLELLRQHPETDCVLLDINMPGMTGLDVLEEIRKDPALKDAHVIVLTAAGEQKHVDRARALGVMAFLTKPFSPRKLYKQVAELLGDTDDLDVGGEGG